MTRHSWEVEDLRLKVDPPNPDLLMTTFCSEYMYGNHTDFATFAIDVDEYIYEKVKEGCKAPK